MPASSCGKNEKGKKAWFKLCVEPSSLGQQEGFRATKNIFAEEKENILPACWTSPLNTEVSWHWPHSWVWDALTQPQFHLLSVPLYFQCYQHALSCTSTGSAGLNILQQHLSCSGGKGRFLQWQLRSPVQTGAETGQVPLVMLPVATAQLDIAGKSLCFLRLIWHRKRSPLCTQSQSKLLLPLLQLVFEEVPWESLKGKKRAPGMDCNRWKSNMTESFTLF